MEPDKLKIPKPSAAVWFFISLLFGLSTILVCSDWVGFLVDEGFTNYGAQRLLAGQIPHKDFFFLWSPGILYWHALWQKIFGASLLAGRFSQLLFCSLIVFCVPLISKLHLKTSVAGANFAACCATLWGFALWNMPYASWYAIAFCYLALLALRRNFFLAGVLFSLSFWMKQNVGILSPVFLLLLYLWLGKFAEIRKVLFGFVLGLMPGFIYFYSHRAFFAFYRQVFLFPFTYKNVMALGLDWKNAAWSRQIFYFIVFCLLGVGVIYFFRLFFKNKKKLNSADVRKLEYLSVALGGFLQVYPRVDFQHILFSFSLLAPLGAMVFDYSFSGRKTFVRAIGVFAMGLLLAAGARENYLLLEKRINPDSKALGVYSRGREAKIFVELITVMNDMNNEFHVGAGAPVLVYPHMESIYYFSGWNNPTPHNQFLPSYVESYGDAQETVLKNFEKAGGRFILYAQNTGLDDYTPHISAQIKADYVRQKLYPEQFSVYEKRTMLKTVDDKKGR